MPQIPTYLVKNTIFAYFLLVVIHCGLNSYGLENNKSDVDEFGPGYGYEWLYFIDENDTRLVMNFTLPIEMNGLLLGDVYFYLYTRQNSNSPELLKDSNDSIHSEFYNKSNNLIVITHGWVSSYKSVWLQKAKNTFLEHYDLNILAVDWNEIAKNIVYPWPALSTRYVGKQVANLLISLMKTYDVFGKQIHLIGHSLGAHVVGHAGMYCNEYQMLYRITGLDPARPLFEIPLVPADFRLESSDAEFVDIIHTSGSIYGYEDRHGHADFFPNGGKPMQPGCKGLRDAVEACSHRRSHILFEESISPEIKFTSYPCSSWEEFQNNSCKENAVYMGYHVTNKAHGNYYLYTRNTSIYAIPEEELNSDPTSGVVE